MAKKRLHIVTREAQVVFELNERDRKEKPQ